MKELNILKFYGILLVVLGHVVFTYSSMSIITPNVPSPILNFVKEVIYAFHMPLFIFSSGCIFAWQLEVKGKSITFMSLFKNKAKRLMIPFFVFGLLMFYPTMVLLGFRDPVHYFINGFILALDPRHLWFVLVLFLIFLVFFCLRKICIKLNIPIWAIAIVAFLLYCFPINMIYFQIRNVEQYLIWFTLGYLFTIYKPVFKYVAIAVGCGIGFNMMMPLPPGLLKLFNAIIGIGAFYILSVTTMRIEKTLIYQSIAPNSFGIYLFHPMVIYWLEFIATPYEINPILLSLCVFIISLTLSIFLTIAVRNIGLGILIGENQNNQIEDSCQIPFPRTSE